MTVKLLTEHHLEFLSLKGGCTCSSDSTFVKMPHCLKSHVVAHLCTITLNTSMLSYQIGLAVTGFWSEPSSISTLCLCEQLRLFGDSKATQAGLSLH